MSYTLKLDSLTHDIHIKDRAFVRVNGSDEICQRIKIALWHEEGEYFLDRQSGIPWYSKILGSKMADTDIINLIRLKIQKVPGVLQVLGVKMSRVVRNYSISVTCYIQGDNQAQGKEVTVSDIYIGG